MATIILGAFYAWRHLPLFVTDLGKQAYVLMVMAALFLYTWNIEKRKRIEGARSRAKRTQNRGR